MAYTPATLKDLMRLGGNLKITDNYTPALLKDLTRLAKANKTMLSIKASKTTPATLKDLVRIGQGYITIEV